MQHVLVFDSLGHQAEVHGRWWCDRVCDCGGSGTVFGRRRAAQAMWAHVRACHTT